MDEINKKMAILVVSYDGYSDLWDDFFTLIDKNWNTDFNIYLSNNNLKPEIKNIKIINNGEESKWSDRTREALKKIPEEYVCLLLEDYFISQPVDDNYIKNVVNFIEKYNVKYYKLSTFSKIKGEKLDKNSKIKIVNPKINYGISLQAAIWDKNFLLDCLGDESYSAWKFENKMNNINELPEKKTDYIYDSTHPLNIIHGVRQGKIIKKGERKLNKTNYLMKNNTRERTTRVDSFKHNIKSIIIFLIPDFLHKKVIKLLEKFGIKSVSQKNK